eukprot:UN29691
MEMLLDSQNHVERLGLVSDNNLKQQRDKTNKSIGDAINQVLTNGKEYATHLFKLLDKNRDGKVDMKEFMEGIPNLLSKNAIVKKKRKSHKQKDYNVSFTVEQLAGVSFSPGLGHKSCVVNNVFDPGSLNLLHKLDRIVSVNGESVEGLPYEAVLKKVSSTASLLKKTDKNKAVDIRFRTDKDYSLRMVEEEKRKEVTHIPKRPKPQET